MCHYYCGLFIFYLIFEEHFLGVFYRKLCLYVWLAFKSGLWWRAYCIWIISVNLLFIPLVCKMLKMRKLQTTPRFCAHNKKQQKKRIWRIFGNICPLLNALKNLSHGWFQHPWNQIFLGCCFLSKIKKIWCFKPPVPLVG